MHPITRRGLLFLIGLIGTFIFLRISLYISPNANFDVGPYNIHHLFTGLLVMTLSCVPLFLQVGKRSFQDGMTFVFAVGLSMALDEWVYLIATDGSDAAYLLPASFWGGVIVIALTSLYCLAIVLYQRKSSAPDEAGRVEQVAGE